VKSAIEKFIRITSADTQCCMYYFVIIVSSVLIYIVLYLQGYYQNNNLIDQVATLFIPLVIVFGYSPFIIKRYFTVKRLINNNDTVAITNDMLTCMVGIILIHCNVMYGGRMIEMVLVKNKKNRQLMHNNTLHLLIDSGTSEHIIMEVYT